MINNNTVYLSFKSKKKLIFIINSLVILITENYTKCQVVYTYIYICIKDRMDYRITKEAILAKRLNKNLYEFHFQKKSNNNNVHLMMKIVLKMNFNSKNLNRSLCYLIQQSYFLYRN